MFCYRALFRSVMLSVVERKYIFPDVCSRLGFWIAAVYECSVGICKSAHHIYVSFNIWGLLEILETCASDILKLLWLHLSYSLEKIKLSYNVDLYFKNVIVHV